MKRTGYRYRSKRAEAHYDCIVIGSGIGGMCTAALRARLGRRICVLEQHYTAGGFLTTSAMLGRDAMKLMRLVKEWRPGAGTAS